MIDKYDWLGEMVDITGVDPNKLRPRLMKGNVYGWEISTNGFEKLQSALSSHISRLETEARLDEIRRLPKVPQPLGSEYRLLTHKQHTDRITELEQQLDKPQEGSDE